MEALVLAAGLKQKREVSPEMNPAHTLSFSVVVSKQTIEYKFLSRESDKVLDLPPSLTVEENNTCGVGPEEETLGSAMDTGAKRSARAASSAGMEDKNSVG